MTAAKLTAELHAVDDDDGDDDVDEETSDGNQPSEGNLSISRCRKVQSLFQIMFYVHVVERELPCIL